MNPRRNSFRDDEHGGVLVVTLIIVVLLGVSLASYLMLARNQSVAVARSQAWNAALILAEAGIEESFAHLNRNGAFTAVVSGGDGWVMSDGFYRTYPLEREMVGGSYSAAFSNAAPPVIYATGYVTVPMSTTILKRAIRVGTTNLPLYTAGLLLDTLKNTSNLSVSGDTYDSGSSAYSTGARYDPGKVKTPTTTNVASAAHIELPDVQPPYTTGLPLPTKSGNTYRLASGNYYISGDLNLAANERIAVDAHRTAVLYVTGNMRMSTNAEIDIGNDANFSIYVGGGSAVLDFISNDEEPRNFQFYGLTGLTNLSLTQVSPTLAGAFYAPNATLTMPGAPSLLNLYGSLVVNEFVVMRPFKFHFDENLMRVGPRRGFAVSSWAEIPAQ